MKKHYYFLKILLISLLVSSCTQESINNEKSLIEDEYFVSITEVETLSQDFLFPVNSNSKKENLGTSSEKKFENKTVSDIKEITNEDGLTSFYVVNYNEGGFILISADKRTIPILGFSEINNFVVNEDFYPEGLGFWVSDTKKRISEIRKLNIDQAENVKVSWSSLKKNKSFKMSEPPIGGGNCPDQIYTEGPLLASKWEQTGGFNNDLPVISCNGGSFQVYAGCVPIAMGKIMHFYEYPTTYDWNSMPLDDATSTTAAFIEDIHVAINNVYSDEPSYSCSATGVGSSKNMGTVLKTQFNFTSASWATYDDDVVMDNIDLGRPVILSGDNGSTGHMWVCDGYRKSILYGDDDCQYASGYLHLSMKWGWDGRYDGYYSYNNFNPGTSNYNNNKKMIYNIIP